MDPWLAVFGIGAYHFAGLIVAEVSLMFCERHEPSRYRAIRWGKHFWVGYVVLVMFWPVSLLWAAGVLVLRGKV